jgi:hypothetical protein
MQHRAIRQSFNLEKPMTTTTLTPLPDGLTRADFEEIKSKILQWKFGTAQGAAGPLKALNAFEANKAGTYNLFNKESGVYLQWEKQSLGINLGWTDHADTATASRTARWFVRRESGDLAPIKYGERLALGYGTQPSFYRYEKRTVGINLANVQAPSAEWQIIGGKVGTPVMTGDLVALYNVNVATDAGPGDFMVRHLRDASGNIGWVTSPESLRFYPLFKKYGPKVAKLLIKALV